MSNLNQFLASASFPLGAINNFPYIGDLLVQPDGSEWLSANNAAGFPYTAAYASTPDMFKSAHGVLNGPDAGGTHRVNVFTTFAYNPATTTWVCAKGLGSEGDTTNGFIYYRSTDDGANWTALTFPNGKQYQVWFVGGQFVGYATSSTTNGCITSPDGATWTSRTAISLSGTTIGNIVSDGGSGLLVINGSTSGAFSLDSGATWTSCALTAHNTGRAYGFATWSPSANLYVVASSTAGAYQTSPTGATWTHRTSSPGFYASVFSNGPNYKLAASPTLIVAVGINGVAATSTDAITWSNHNIIDDWSGAPGSVYYDGTRFVVLMDHKVYYSTNGTSWTQGGHFLPASIGATSDIVTSGRVLRPIGGGNFRTQLPMLLDPTATAPAYIRPPFNSAPTTNMTYFRIK